jgi:hypothetical protein
MTWAFAEPFRCFYLQHFKSIISAPTLHNQRRSFRAEPPDPLPVLNAF